MLASTNRLIAGPLPPGPLLAEVERISCAGTGPPPIVNTAVAFAVNTPAELLLIVSVQVAVFPLMTGFAQVFVFCRSGAGATLVVIAPKTTGVAPAGIA